MILGIGGDENEIFCKKRLTKCGGLIYINEVEGVENPKKTTSGYASLFNIRI